MKRFLRLFMLLPVVMLVPSGCSRQNGDVIRIGAAGPMTGDQSKMGIDLRNAVELAAAEWNERGGVLGKKIVVVSGDDQADPKQAVSIANKYVNQKVAAVVGHWNSNCSINASPFYNNANVVMISPASTNPRLTRQGFKTVFRVCGTDDQQGSVAAEYVIKKLRPKRIAVLHDKSTYGQGLADYFKRAVEGKAQVVFSDGITQRDPDYKAVLTTIKQKSPDVYFFGGVYPEAGRLARQAKEIGLTAPMVTGDGVYDPMFLKIAGEAADGTYVTFGKDPSGLSTARTFIENYKKRFGDPGPYSIYAYDAANILLTAIRETGSTEGAGLAEYISKTTFKGAFGEIAFDGNGDVRKAPYVVWLVKDKVFHEVQ